MDNENKIETCIFLVESPEKMPYKPLIVNVGEDVNIIQNRVNMELSRVQTANYNKGRLDMINFVLYAIHHGQDLEKIKKRVEDQKQVIRDMYQYEGEEVEKFD